MNRVGTLVLSGLAALGVQADAPRAMYTRAPLSVGISIVDRSYHLPQQLAPRLAQHGELG